MNKSHKQIKHKLKKKQKRDSIKKEKSLSRKTANQLEKKFNRLTYLMQETVRKTTAKISSITHKNPKEN
tara:strand:- start:276 stop:482 length:207 start_codon:yes stop_codon:yes gene_type:complete